MKTLIVYYSFTSNNELLAIELQKKLQCDVLKLEEVKKRTGLTILLDVIFNRRTKIKKYNVAIKDYENLILIAPIWAGKIATPLNTFLKNEKKEINHYSFITLCGGNKGQKEKIFYALTLLLQKEPEQVTELWINDLLPENEKDTIKHTSGYRAKQSDLELFKTKIDNFLVASHRFVEYE
jgi:flavodoxin